MRFPEFVLAWHCKDGDTMFTALQGCARLYRALESTTVVELRLFRKFLLEKFTVDELSFFLELQATITAPIPNDVGVPIMVPYTECRAKLEQLLGQYSPVVQIIAGEAEKFVKQGLINYANFALVVLRFYRNERRKRRSAIRLMFHSKQDHMTFEHFVGMVQPMGFHG
jgi:hypothetical protein